MGHIDREGLVSFKEIVLNKDTHKRTVVKAIMYRLFGFSFLAVVTWFVTHEIEQVTVVTIIYHTASIAGYYIHERFWGHIKWGKD